MIFRNWNTNISHWNTIYLYKMFIDFPLPCLRWVNSCKLTHAHTHTHTHRDSSAAGDPPMVPWAFWGGKCPCRATVGWAQATTKWPRPWPRPWKPQESSHVLACFNLYQKYVHLKPLIPSLVEKQYYYIYIYIIAIWNYQRASLLFSSDVLELPEGNWPHWSVQIYIYIYIQYTYIYLYIYDTISNFPSQIKKKNCMSSSPWCPELLMTSRFPRHISLSLGGGHSRERARDTPNYVLGG